MRDTQCSGLVKGNRKPFGGTNHLYEKCDLSTSPNSTTFLSFTVWLGMNNGYDPDDDDDINLLRPWNICCTSSKSSIERTFLFFSGRLIELWFVLKDQRGKMEINRIKRKKRESKSPTPRFPLSSLSLPSPWVPSMRYTNSPVLFSHQNSGPDTLYTSGSKPLSQLSELPTRWEFRVFKSPFIL